jgi:hypothetical protein
MAALSIRVALCLEALSIACVHNFDKCFEAIRTGDQISPAVDSCLPEPYLSSLQRLPLSFQLLP